MIPRNVGLVLVVLGCASIIVAFRRLTVDPSLHGRARFLAILKAAGVRLNRGPGCDRGAVAFIFIGAMLILTSTPIAAPSTAPTRIGTDSSSSASCRA